MKTDTELDRKLPFILTIFIFFIYLVSALKLDGSYGGGDGIRHFLVSRWSWQHPDLFLYHWGKPFFTLITSPFSQFGLTGIKIFNALAGTITSFLAYLIARKLKFANPEWVIVFSAFAPIYMMCINSGLTEPLFALILTFCIYLFLTASYVPAVILLSFLPFVRSEGNLIIPVFALVLLIRGNWKYIPLFASGTVIYSIVGYFHYKDIFWIKTKNPYTGSNYDIYGQGELLHFVKSYDLILGLPLTILFCAGVVIGILYFMKNRKQFMTREGFLPEEMFLIYGSFAVYFIAHSLFWWKGLFGSLGLERAIAGVIPLAGIIGYRGLSLSLSRITKTPFISVMVTVGISFWLITYPFLKHYLPLKLEPEEQLVKEAGVWLNSSEYKDEKIFYLYPYFMHIINRDPFNGSKVGELWGLYPAIDEWGIDGAVPLNTVVLWDSHFGANEAYLPLEKLMSDPNFKLIKSFRPEVPFKTLGGHDFEIHAFLRVIPSELKIDSEEFYDLESDHGLGNASSIIKGSAISGTHLSFIDQKTEFGVLFERKISDIKNFNSLKRIDYSFALRTGKTLKNVKAVLSVDSNNQSLLWTGKDVIPGKSEEWETVNINFPVDFSEFKPESSLKVYIWNPDGSEFYMDDIRIQFRNY
jgi:hypothetical protein